MFVDVELMALIIVILSFNFLESSGSAPDRNCNDSLNIEDFPDPLNPL